MKLLYNITEQHYLVLNITNGGYFLFKVDSTRPIILSRVIENQFIDADARRIVIKNMEDFVENELKNLSENW